MQYYHLAEMIHRRAEEHPEKTALVFFDKKKKRWKNISWKHFSQKIMRTAWAMAETGIQPKDCIGIYAQNMRQYLYTDFAIYANRGIVVPLFATSSPSQVEYIVNDAEIKVLFVGEQFQYNNAFKVQQQSKILQKIIVFDSNVVFHPQDKTSEYFDDFIASGENSNTEVIVNVRMNSVREDDIACIIYTSGTTGESKGVVLPHSNFMEVLRIHDQRLITLSSKDTSLCFLPLAHIFEKGWTYVALHRSMTVAINQNPQEIKKTIRQIRPTIMCSVPRFWEKVYEGVKDIVNNASGIKKWLLNDAIKTGEKHNIHYKQNNIKPPLGNKIKFFLYNNTIFRLLKVVVGIERGNIFPCAGAPLSDSINKFLHSVNIPIVYGYGLTETTASVSCFLHKNFHFGTVGTVMPHIDVKIGENNEILVKGKTVMREYYKKEQATKEAFTEDGYFRTGDAGQLTELNEIILTERIKDLFKTVNGKYIAPQALETKLQENKFIDQVAIIADQRKFVSALIVPNFEQLKAFANKHMIAFDSLNDLIENIEIKKLIANQIELQEIEFASFEKVKRFTLLAQPFSIEGGELTNTLKIRRKVINERYATIIDAMYQDTDQHCR